MESTYPLDNIPRAAKPVYYDRGGFPATGLVVDLIKAVRNHPVHALTLSARTDVDHCRVGYPVQVTFLLTSAGSEPLGVATSSCREIVSGTLSVTGSIFAREGNVASGDSVKQEAILSHAEFGGKYPPYPLAGTLTPAARKDLATVRILNPGEVLALPYPRKLKPSAAGYWQFSLDYLAIPRYEQGAVDAALGARLITGRLWASVTVTVR